MDKNQPPSEPSTVRPSTAPTIESWSQRANYGRRLFIVSAIAYVFPLIAIVLPAFLLIASFPVGAGLDGLIYVLRYGTIPTFLAYIVASEAILLIMSMRYLLKGRLTGKARVAAIVSLVVYSLLTAVLVVFYALWMGESNQSALGVVRFTNYFS
ncbi:MAG TPA: hypothetical protein VLG09_00350 [Candidatus Saccharimonadales bacterium]|nr:hypothetical protein [Candidatus Saccharimonadales bacterium]